MQPIIQAKNLDFVYNKGKDNEYHALINISLDIYPEEYIVIFGPSGCGKSTLLNVIAGLEVPDSGSVFVFGKNLIDLTEKEYEVLRLSYGLDCDKHTAKEIAAKLKIDGVSNYVRISELKKQAVQKLIDNVDHSQVIDYL